MKPSDFEFAVSLDTPEGIRRAREKLCDHIFHSLDAPLLMDGETREDLVTTMAEILRDADAAIRRAQKAEKGRLRKVKA